MGLRGRLPVERVPSPALVLAAAVSVQGGASIAVKLFADVGALGAVWLRLALSAVLMCVIAPPRLRGAAKPHLAQAAGFGLVLAAMNFSFYLAIDRIPLGPAVTIEFVGPLAVAVVGSRRLIDLLWVVVAAAAVALLTDAGTASGGTGSLNASGLVFAGLAGVCWFAYILLSQRVGRHFSGSAGLTMALLVGAVVLTAPAIAVHGRSLDHPGVLGAGAALAVLCSAVPYSLELVALRRLKASTFGVLLSLDPAVAALSGWLLLGQHLRGREWLAVACVVVASAGASLTARRTAVPGGPATDDRPAPDDRAVAVSATGAE